MDKIGVIGDYDSIYGFAALGLHTFPVTDPEEASRLVRRLAENGYGILYLTEELASEIQETVDHYKEKLSPAIILIPGIHGNTGEGIRGVHASVEKAVGSDILFHGK